MPDKKRLAMYWMGSCGGCEISVANLDEYLLEVMARFDLVFCPCLVDAKKDDVRRMEDRWIDVALLDGAVRTEEDAAMARLLRRKSATLVAFGACASWGGIPALADLAPGGLGEVFLGGPTIDNPRGIVPSPRSTVPGGEMELPALRARVGTAGSVVEVDYSVPGCPPESHQLRRILELVAAGAELPPRGAVLGAGRSTVCDECKLKREDKTIGTLKRPHEVVPDPSRCLLEQGILCMGVATRDGCGALCPRVAMPCTGCYGPAEGALDQGARMAGTVGGILDVRALKGLPEAGVAPAAGRRVDPIPDVAGTFYKYTFAQSVLGRLRGGAR